MKNRILSIADKSKKKTGIIVICFALILTICTSLVLAANAPSTENPNSDLSESLVEKPKEDAILTENSNETVTMQINSLSITTPKGQEPILNDDGTITLPGGGTFERLFNGDKLTVLSGAVIESNGNIDESHPANKGKKIILESANGDIMVIDESGTVFINGKTVEEICNEAAAMRATADENVEEDIENLDFYGDWEYNGHLQLQDNISWKGYNEGNNYVYELKTDGTKITVSPPSTIDCLNNKKYGYIKFNKECKIDYSNGVTVNAPINTLIEFENDKYTITIGDGEAIITRQSGIPETIPTGTVLNNKGDIRSDYIIKESDMDEVIRYPAPGEKNNQSYIWPLENNQTIMSTFETKINAYTGETFSHNGVDIQANLDTPVMAASSGRVKEADYGNENGLYVIIDHGNGVGTLYACLNGQTVKEGDEVKQGDIIGNVGSTGPSTGPHLHFGILINDEFVDPLMYFPNDSTEAVLSEQRDVEQGN